VNRFQHKRWSNTDVSRFSFHVAERILILFVVAIHRGTSNNTIWTGSEKGLEREIKKWEFANGRFLVSGGRLMYENGNFLKLM
jgi:hypothetical protein